MGVYIPKMILPQDCWECPFFMDEEFTWCGRASFTKCDGRVERQGKPDWCDLVELNPPDAERNLGRWELHDDGCPDYKCSVCGRHAYRCFAEVHAGDYHYCPHCGAKMEQRGD